jgi:hypothetical protein
MANPDERCTVDLGDSHDRRSLRHEVEHLEDETVAALIEGYLELTGVILGRSNPGGWFFWLDPPTNSRFITRCSDPPASTAPDSKRQPWYYYVTAEIREPGRAIAVDFGHVDSLKP